MTAAHHHRDPTTAVFETSSYFPPHADRQEAPRVLIEVPHGATSWEHYDRVWRQLRGALPADLDSFYYVNTDVGAPEVAAAIAQQLAAKGLSVMVLRSLLPRTFVDCNRSISYQPKTISSGGVTPSIPSFVTDSVDRALLERLHGQYRREAERLYELVCGPGGTALSLHTYAPRSITLHSTDASIVTMLRAAYEPDQYELCPPRPEVDLITMAPGGEKLGHSGLAQATLDAYRAAGIDAVENETYRLVPATMGALFSRRYRGQVLCIEIRRDLLADPWIPFLPSKIGAAKVQRMAAPIVDALQNALLGVAVS